MLIRKMLRDMKINKSQFISIFLMIFLGVFIYAGISSDWNGLYVSSNAFYEETKLADVWVYGSGFQEHDVTLIKDKKEVKNVQRRAVLDTVVKNQQKKKIELYILEDNTISTMKVMKGQVYQEGADGIWIDQSYAKANHLKLGDTFTLECNGISLSKEIKGFVLHPEMVYQSGGDTILPDFKNNGYAFVSKAHIGNSEQIPFTQLLISTKNPTKMEQLVSDTLGKSNLTFVAKKDMVSYATLRAEITQHQAFGDVFPIVFLLIAVLTTMTTVSKMIVNQRLQIGILKALGFQNYKVTLHYLSHVIVVASVGAFLGFITGPLVVPSLIFPMMKSVYQLPELKGVPMSSSIVVVFASIAVCFLVAYIVCHRQLKEKPASALRPAIIVYKRKRKGTRRIWNRLNFYAQWNVRDILRNKVRSCIAILGVAGCMGLLVCAFGMKNSMDYMVNMMFHELQTYEMRIALDTDANVEELKRKMNGTAVLEGAIELKYESIRKTASLTVQEDTRYLKLQNTKLDTVRLPKEGIALSYNMAKAMNTDNNDTISWRMMGTKTWIKSKVKEIIHTPSSQGITMSKDVFEESGRVFAATGIVGDKANMKQIQGVTSIQYLKEDIAKSMDTMLEGMNLMIMILLLGAIVLGLVVLYNIGTFSYIEKIRDMATLKVLGFRNTSVNKLLRQQNLWLTLVGILFGIPFGYGLIYTVVSTIGESMDMIIVVEPLTYIGCTVFTLGVSMFVIFIVSRKTKTIDMVSALKAME